MDLSGDRRLILEHRTGPGRLLARGDAEGTLRHVAALWGYEGVMQEVDVGTDAVLVTCSASPAA